MPSSSPIEAGRNTESAIAELADALEQIRREFASLREAVLRAPCDLAERVWRFRRQRLDAVARGETPIPLQAGPRLVLHLLPHAAFAEPAPLVRLHKTEFLIFGRGGSPAYNADGKLMWPDDRQEREQRGYAQMSRSGWIEALMVLRRVEPTPHGSGTLYVTEIERLIISGATEYLGALAKLDLGGAVQVAITLAGVKGSSMTHGSSHRSSALPIALNEIVLPSVNLPGPALTEREVPMLLRSALDILWQTGGWPACPSFCSNDDYQPR